MIVHLTIITMETISIPLHQEVQRLCHYPEAFIHTLLAFDPAGPLEKDWTCGFPKLRSLDKLGDGVHGIP
jgi:hypothetical protein